MKLKETVRVDVGAVLDLGSERCKVVEYFLDRDASGKWDVIVRLDFGAKRDAPHGRKLLDIPLPELAQRANKEGLKIVKRPKRAQRPKRYD